MDVRNSIVPTFGLVDVTLALKKRNDEHYQENNNDDFFDSEVGKNFTDFALLLADFA